MPSREGVRTGWETMTSAVRRAGEHIGRLSLLAVGSAVLGGAIVAYYSFVGFETSANIIEEVKRPSRVYPRALFGALVTAGIVYVLVGVASAAALPSDELQESTGPLLAVVEATG